MRACAVLIAVALAAAGGAGCKKKPKPTEADPGAGGTAAPNNPGTPVGQTGTGTTTPSGGAGGTNVGIVPAGGIGVVTNPGAVAGGGGGGGAAMAVRKAADRSKVRAAMADLRLNIETASAVDPNGRLPSPKDVYAMVKQAAPQYAQFIDDGDIVLNPNARSREDVWAWEGKPPYGRHMVLTSQGVEEMDAPALRARLGLK